MERLECDGFPLRGLGLQLLVGIASCVPRPSAASHAANTPQDARDANLAEATNLAPGDIGDISDGTTTLTLGCTSASTPAELDDACEVGSCAGLDVADWYDDRASICATLPSLGRFAEHINSITISFMNLGEAIDKIPDAIAKDEDSSCWQIARFANAHDDDGARALAAARRACLRYRGLLCQTHVRYIESLGEVWEQFDVLPDSPDVLADLGKCYNLDPIEFDANLRPRRCSSCPPCPQQQHRGSVTGELIHRCLSGWVG